MTNTFKIESICHFYKQTWYNYEWKEGVIWDIKLFIVPIVQTALMRLRDKSIL